MTLREFLKITREHYRVYQPNRDCLIFESYFTTHSPFYFNEDHINKGEFCNRAYYEDNKYNQAFYDNSYKNPYVDKETEIFLDKYGDYKIFSLEIAAFKPHNIHKDDKGNVIVEETKDKYRPHSEYLDCYNIFIIDYNSRDCGDCEHSIRVDKENIRDNKDPICRGCNKPNKVDEYLECINPEFNFDTEE